MNKMRYKPQIQLKKRLQKEQEKYYINQLQYGLDELRMTHNQPLVNLNKHCLDGIFQYSCPGGSLKRSKKKATFDQESCCVPQQMPINWIHESSHSFQRMNEWGAVFPQ